MVDGVLHESARSSSWANPPAGRRTQSSVSVGGKSGVSSAAAGGACVAAEASFSLLRHPAHNENKPARYTPGSEPRTELQGRGKTLSFTGVLMASAAHPPELYSRSNLQVGP
ncbi:Hypothetical predicted protein [Xyrichtys novacula]|uniref:Uncharacterized protein n=1 Tax=Xyrichtys novacula TaxID=13765 RepID=A0AAV1GAL1_XYRNO|nr:Hypothetical predicted protein [Xyrichtys novacula]